LGYFGEAVEFFGADSVILPATHPALGLNRLDQVQARKVCHRLSDNLLSPKRKILPAPIFRRVENPLLFLDATTEARIAQKVVKLLKDDGFVKPDDERETWQDLKRGFFDDEL
jgi:hypothetical protein